MIWNTKGTNIDPWGTPWLIVGDFRSTNVNRLAFFPPYKLSTLLKKLSRLLVFILCILQILWKQRCCHLLPCLLCMLCCCMYTRALMTSLYTVRTHLVTLNLLWAVKQVMVLFLPALCRTLFMFSLSWKVDWVFPRVPKHWLTLPPPFFLQNTPI